MVYVDTQHQTGGESWGVRRGGGHGKGDCQIRRNHRYQTSVTQKFEFQKEVMLRISSGSSGNRAVTAVAQQKQRDGSTNRGGEKRNPPMAARQHGQNVLTYGQLCAVMLFG